MDNEPALTAGPFTWEDVDLLASISVTDLGAVPDGVTDCAPAFEKAARVGDLANRIAALLPPRESDAEG